MAMENYALVWYAFHDLHPENPAGLILTGTSLEPTWGIAKS